MAVMLDFLASTAYFLQLSNDKFERQNIIYSDRWKAKDFEFFHCMNQEIKETASNLTFRGSNSCD